MRYLSFLNTIAPYIFLSLALCGFLELSACDNANPSCDQAIELFQSNFLGDTECVQGCADGDVSGRFDSSAACSGSPFATSWYHISSGVEDRVFNLELNSADLSQMVVTLYAGDCDTFTAIECNNGKSRSVHLRNVFLEAGSTYYVAVSSLQDGQGTFDLCYSYAPDENQCNKQPTITVISTSLGSPLSGPFKANEDVELCYTISGFENNGCNYLQGIVPFFGDGWSEDSFNPDGSPRNITTPLTTQGHTSFTTSNPICEGDPAGTWSWYETGVLSYNLNSTNPMAYRFGDDIESGWVFLNSFDPSCFEFDDACCVNPTADPNQSFGDDNYPICGGGPTHEWTICISLTTATPTDCDDNTDCLVGFKSFADGELGAFRSNDCSRDRVTYINASVDCCTAPTLTTDAAQLELCPQETVTIDLEIDDASASLFWIDDQGVINKWAPGARQLTLTAPDSGQQIYELYATNGCNSDPLIIQVSTTELSQVELDGSATICEGEEAQLQLDLVGVAPWTVVFIDDNGQTQTVVIDESTYTRAYTPAANLNITIQSATDGNGCEAELSGAFEVTLSDGPEFLSDSEFIKYCNQDVELSAEATVPGSDYLYEWFDALENNLGAGELLEVSRAGEYTLMVTDNNTGCQATSLITVVDNPDDLKVNILSGNSIAINEGGSTPIELNTNLDQTELASIVWQGPDGLDCYDCLNPLASPTADATYTITIEDIYGCVATLTVDIVITDQIQKARSLYIPTVFQPSNAEESTFCVFDDGQSEALISMEVYDRWGSPVFSVQNANVSEACWDGTSGGRLLEQGVYVYKLEVRYPDEDEIRQSGTLTLLR